MDKQAAVSNSAGRTCVSCKGQQGPEAGGLEDAGAASLESEMRPLEILTVA